MKNTTKFNIGHVLLSLGALIVFLAAPYLSFGGKYAITGIDMLERMSNDDGWMALFVITPLLALFADLFSSKIFRVILTLSMCIPIIILFTKLDQIELGWGGALHLVLVLGALIVAFTFPDEDTTSDGHPAAPDGSANAGESGNPEVGGGRPASVAPGKRDAATQAARVRTYDRAKLNEIVDNAAMYRPELVARCREELTIREKSQAFTEQVAAMDEDRLREILTDPMQYAEELIYACEQEQARREAARLEQKRQQEEQLRIQREQQAEAERQAQEQRRREAAARWQKQRKYVLFGVLILILISLVIGSIGYYRKQKALREKQELLIEQLRIARERLEQ